MTNEQEKYLKARSDLIKAFKSFNDLTEQQKECLAKEIIGAEQFMVTCRILYEMRRGI